MSIFLWYSKKSQETGIWLAERLNILNHGTIPPRNFEGSIICWGAIPSEKFKWEKRNFQAIFNDPRTIRPLLDRKLLFDKVSSVGIPVVRCAIVSQNDPQYQQICETLDVSVDIGFVLCTLYGFRHKHVTNQQELTANLGGEKPRIRAVTSNFITEDRIRVYVVENTVLGASRYSHDLTDENFLSKISMSVTENWDDYTNSQVTSIFRRAIELKLVQPACGVWTAFSITNPNMQQRALTIAQNLNFDFCAIDFSTDGAMTVLNIVTAPNLREVTSVQSAITNAFFGWVSNNSRTAKDILIDLITNASGAEVSSFFKEVSNVKGKIGEAVKQEKLASDNKITSRTASLSSQQTQ